MSFAKNLLHPSPEEKRKQKKKHLVQSPNSYFMDIKCPNCYEITTVFSHVCWLLHCSLSANRRKSKAYRRMLLQKEAALEAPQLKMSGKPSQ